VGFLLGGDQAGHRLDLTILSDGCAARVRDEHPGAALAGLTDEPGDQALLPLGGKASDISHFPGDKGNPVGLPNNDFVSSDAGQPARGREGNCLAIDELQGNGMWCQVQHVNAPM
jgi:hypothetical protein